MTIGKIKPYLVVNIQIGTGLPAMRVCAIVSATKQSISISYIAFC
jgi:hypothetical protein